ncbi:hypothetical protein [Amphritea japonica]|uniref:Acetyl-CoA C-acetyltransferase n=1 Tax=Amphritea japonica ATCC BAA-1530 TaxID=1278309 RepID=A0A7R6P7S5_9GAMM|nr:hypothetical protein [Amphritea japonica]BBB27489.1 acetyl-CoA C-acetyltransferase [Amphritea japonica ATCC BAA-1530]
MSKALLFASAKTVDNSGSLQHCLALENQLHQNNINITELIIDPLSTPWHSEIEANHFRSGCGPIEATALARDLITSGKSDAVIISGKDLLKTGYDREQRLDLMAVYGKDYPLTAAYNELAEQFIHRHGADAKQFHQLAHHLFENYKCSYRNVISDKLSAEQLPDERWYNHITPLFRGVDCANPLIDFSGRILIGNEKVTQLLDIPVAEQLEITGVGLGYTPGDGKQHIEDIVSYEHLQQAYTDACQQSGIDFAAQFRAGDALLETYTCYPVVPIAFLLASGLVDLLEQVPEFLEQHLITITGGMNLAKGPWNNPALNSLIEMHQQLITSPDHQIGAVHGNGGLGYKQGVAILKKAG